MTVAVEFKPGDLVKARGREWVVLPETGENLLRLRPLGGSEEDATLIYLPLEPRKPEPAAFSRPKPENPGSRQGALLLRDALRLKLRSGAGPFRSFGNLAFEPRAYQLVPLLMSLKLDLIRLLVADDVGIGKTIEAGLVAREMLDRGEIERTTVICPPHLCDQWQEELSSKFHIQAEIVRTGTASRLERGLRPGESVFEVYPHTVVSLDYIKADRRRDDFLRACPEFVIVDEAHACVQSNSAVRHQRYQLLKGLAGTTTPKRHMVLLTATPHSGDDTAFHNLLGLLDPQFLDLKEIGEGSERSKLRDRLSNHFVQRRRGDIAEWRDSAGFPVRESREATYPLGGEWGALFEDVLEYARGMVRRTEKGSRLEQRMSWWAALALLRCVSSSPSAASMALRTRLKSAEGNTEEQQLLVLDQEAGERVLDGQLEEGLSRDETVPAGTVETSQDGALLRRLINRADKLRSLSTDPKAGLLASEVKRLVREGFRPVVFCRYIATANYLEGILKGALHQERVHVLCVTGELPSEEREERIRALAELEEGIVPVLVATDCLSEGINLQRHFNGVVHYDLTWNPTRHEQREGRVDRFGQGSPVVRTLMLYGSNNPVDGAVLKVILRKAEKIRKELGVAVPLPMDNTQVIEAVMKAVLLHNPKKGALTPQLSLGFEEVEHQVDVAWQREKDRVSRTVFAQKRLRPDEVLPEWQKAVSFMGGEKDVYRFVREVSTRLGAALEEKGDHYRFPCGYLPKPLQERLESVGLSGSIKLAFQHPAPTGVDFVPRSHPLVATLADYVAEQALESDRSDLGARCSAFFTEGVKTRTTVFLLRLRCQLAIEKRKKGIFTLDRTLLSEECLGVAVEGGTSALRVLSDEKVFDLLSLEAGRNMSDGQKTHLVSQALETLDRLEPELEALARRRAEELLEDHRRIREASEVRGVRYAVTPALPVDVIGVYVLVPLAGQ
jgi:superfamily II DNA or RNA helicase